MERFFVDALSAPFAVKDPKHVIKVKTFFRSCMDEGAIEKRGMFPARQLIEKVDYGGKYRGLDCCNIIDDRGQI